jgi:hypothetical protein
MSAVEEPTKPSPAPSRHTGVARMDAFESAASWEFAGGESLVVKFDREQLSLDQNLSLQQFRPGIPPIVLQLAGGVKRNAVIVAYGARDNSFYLTWL